MADQPVHRSLHTHRPDEIEVRQSDEDDGMMAIRLPIASTGDVRNEGDEPLSTAELRGMAEQINDRTIGVFPEHGQSDKIDFAGYSQFEKLGYWDSAEVEREAADDGEDLLMATARMPDPEPLPSQTGTYREALAILKEQAVRGIPITSSIGWREDDGAPGGNDLLEVSIVGIGADPRTATEGGEALVARAAVAAGVDPDDLVASVREAVREDYPDDARPLGPPGDRDRFETFDECVATLSEDDDVSEADAETICGAWEQASSADDPTDTHDMTDDDTETETDDGEQHDADGDDTETRAPSDIELLDWAELLASHIDGVDSADLMDAWEGFAEDYVGEVDLNELASFVADVTDSDTGTVQDRLDELMDAEQQAEDDDEEDEEEDDEEQSADETDEDEERGAEEHHGREYSDEERSADDEDDSDIEERLAELEEELAAVRSGEVSIETPDPDDDEDADEQRDADTDDTDPAEKPAWAR